MDGCITCIVSYDDAFTIVNGRGGALFTPRPDVPDAIQCRIVIRYARPGALAARLGAGKVGGIAVEAVFKRFAGRRVVGYRDLGDLAQGLGQRTVVRGA